jgi:hypothetical protein
MDTGGDCVDTRKNVKVSSSVKDRLTDVKKMTNFKTESEVLAYLILVNTWAMGKMPTNIYLETIKLAKELDRAGGQINIEEAIKKAQKLAVEDPTNVLK